MSDDDVNFANQAFALAAVSRMIDFSNLTEKDSFDSHCYYVFLHFVGGKGHRRERSRIILEASRT
jgi:hypothetical protein